MVTGVPFSGPQGKVCKDMLHRAGFVETELFYTNVLMCTCPAQPSKDVLENCKDSLDEVISVTKPRMILSLGAIAGKRLGQTDAPGIPFEYKGISTVPCTHPAAIARAKGREEKAKLTETIRYELDTARRTYMHGD
jgi:uracil-DNA glycosylase family 4